MDELHCYSDGIPELAVYCYSTEHGVSSLCFVNCLIEKNQIVQRHFNQGL